MLANLLFGFTATLLIECGVAYSLGYRTKDALYAVGLINLLTNPLLNYILWTRTNSTLVEILIYEIIVIIVEAFSLGFALRRSIKSCLALSGAMNCVSFGIGWIIVVNR